MARESLRRVRERNGRLGREVAMNSLERGGELANLQLAGVEAVGVRQILDREAARPLRGGDRELDHDSLFGDAHLQTDLFRL